MREFTIWYNGCKFTFPSQVYQDPEGNKVQAESVQPLRLQQNHYGIENDDLFSRGRLQDESLQEESQ